LQDNQHSSENKYLQKEKRRTTSACAHTSDFFVSHSPLFPGQSSPTDCPKAGDLRASRLLVILPKAGQPRNLAGLDTWKLHVPQLVIEFLCNFIKLQPDANKYVPHCITLLCSASKKIWESKGVPRKERI